MFILSDSPIFEGRLIPMKKFFALALALVMSMSLVACGSSGSSSAGSAGSTSAASGSGSASASGSATTDLKGQAIAFCSDVGSIDDESFNQFSYAGVTSVAKKDNLSSNYYIPTEDTTEARETDIRQAINDGATVVVCTGYMYGESLAWGAKQYPNVKFIGIDLTQSDVGGNYDNVYCISFKEEQAGYLAGYAVVMDGFTKLGFLGGMAVPAVVRYGYGYVQGADAAAQELGTKVEMNYWYGGQFYGDATITAKMEGWYSAGTQIVFACGGGIYTSAVEAALNHDGKVVGVDVDQNYIGAKGVSDGSMKYNPFVTSAMKSLQLSVEDALNTYFAGNWTTLGGTFANLGLQEGDYVGLPTDKDSWNFSTFTVDQYNAVVEKIKSGEIKIDNSSDDATKPATSASITVNYMS